MPPAGTVAFKSFGCKLNQYEIQALREGFLKQGYAEVSEAEAADYYVLNTCTVTAEADAEARRLIRAWHRRNPGAQIVVTGCYATASPDEIRAIPGVTLVATNRDKNRILFRITGVPETSEEESPFFRDGVSGFEERSRAFVKVQDGCNYFCAFCKIPYVRGRLASRDEAAVLAEIARLAGRGYREIVLSGVCLGSYGKDRGRPALMDLLRRASDLPGRFRLRLSSIDPRDTPLELASLMDGSGRLVPHLHLSLQSGDDGVLWRMRRGYTSAEFAELVDGLRARVPPIGLSTDLIVGFPGEDEAAFEATCAFLKRIAFHRVHVFPYSERPGTRAAGLDGTVAPSVIRERTRRLKPLLEEVAAGRLDAYVGRELEVLVETRGADRAAGGPGPARLEGFSEHYARCVFDGPAALASELVRVRALGREGLSLRCTLPASA